MTSSKIKKHFYGKNLTAYLLDGRMNTCAYVCLYVRVCVCVCVYLCVHGEWNVFAIHGIEDPRSSSPCESFLNEVTYGQFREILRTVNSQFKY
jgi:hypothetical protein